ncbi:MAG: hypothetical protein KY459_09030 [Acidobacteria bacterium]|nr:hypothetical protein [Acidobacteriota bacterium]
MRDEMLAAVVRRAMEHQSFRRALIEEPRAALDAHGFALEDEEFRQIEKLGSELAADDSRESLERIADRFGVQPEKFA